MFVWLGRALLLVTGLLPFVFYARTDELFEFNKMIFVYLAAITIGTAWLINQVLQEKKTWLQWPPWAWSWLVLLSAHFLATLFSTQPLTSVFGYYSRFHGGLLSTLAYLVIAGVASQVMTIKLRQQWLRTLLISLLLVCAYAIPEKLGVSPSCILVTGQWNVTCWVQDVQTRVFGTFGQPNWLAAYLVAVAPLTLHLIAAEKRWQWRLAGAAGWITALVTLLFTGSRSGFLAWLTIVMGVLTMAAIRRSRKVIGSAIFGLVSTVVLVAMLGSPLSGNLQDWWHKWQATAPESQVEQASAAAEIESASSSSILGAAAASPSASISASPSPAPSNQTALESGGTESSTIRRIVWKGAWDIFLAHPLLGTGLETFATAYYKFKPIEHNLTSEWDFLYNRAHNEFLNVLATTGAIGLLAHLLWLGAPLLWLGRHFWQQRNNQGDLSGYILIGILALQVTNFFGFSTVTVALLTWLLPLLGIVAIEPKKTHQLMSRYLEIEINAKTVMATLIGIGGLWFIYQTIIYWQNDRLLARSKMAADQGYINTALQDLETITGRASQEPVYWEQYAILTSRIAASLAAENRASETAEFATVARASAREATKLDPAHINYWKTRARVELALVNLDPQALDQARIALEQAFALAPTDAKVAYNLALLAETAQEPEAASQWYRKAIELRPVYEEAIRSYAEFLETQDNTAAATIMYQRYLELKPDDQEIQAKIKPVPEPL